MEIWTWLTASPAAPPWIAAPARFPAASSSSPTISPSAASATAPCSWPGPGVFGPPRDRDQALAVLREAVENGVTHIDTSDFYGPVHRQRADPGGAPPLPGGPAHRHQGRAPAAAPTKLAPAAGPARPQGAGPGEPRAPRRGRLDVVNLRLSARAPADGVRRRTVRRPRRTPEGGPDPSPRPQRGLGRPNSPRRSPSHPSSPCRTSTTWPTAPTTRWSTGAPARASPTRPIFPLGGFKPAAVRRRSTASPPDSTRHPIPGRARLAPAPLAHHRAHPRHVVGGPPARERRGAGLVLPADAIEELDTIGS